MIDEVRDRLRSITTNGTAEFLSGATDDAGVDFFDFFRFRPHTVAEKDRSNATIGVIDEKDSGGADEAEWEMQPRRRR